MSTVTSVITGNKIAKDLQGIAGLETGFKPVPIHQARIVLTGQPGSGKSTLSNSDPSILVLDPEQGGKTVADPKATRFTPPPNTPLEELDLAYIKLVDRIIARKLKGKNDIKMICIDTIDKLIDLFQTSLCLREGSESVGDVGGGHGRGYAMVRESIWSMLDRIHRAGMGWILIAHSATKFVAMPDGSQRQTTGLAVSPSYVQAIWKDCEHMLFFEHGIQTVIPTPTIKIVRGKKTTKTHAPVHQPVRKLKTAPGGLWQGGNTNDVKVRVPLSPEIVIPELKGFATLTQDYDRAIETLINRDAYAEQD